MSEDVFGHGSVRHMITIKCLSPPSACMIVYVCIILLKRQCMLLLCDQQTKLNLLGNKMIVDSFMIVNELITN